MTTVCKDWHAGASTQFTNKILMQRFENPAMSKQTKTLNEAHKISYDLFNVTSLATV